jgi:uncharacterized protein (UPF0548 family)
MTGSGVNNPAYKAGHQKYLDVRHNRCIRQALCRFIRIKEAPHVRGFFYGCLHGFTA